jgi:hypothetical protein
MTGDDLVFVDEPAAGAGAAASAVPRKVVIADDEPNVHDVTRLALANFTFDGRALAFIHASNSIEARAAVADNPDAVLEIRKAYRDL